MATLPSYQGQLQNGQIPSGVDATKFAPVNSASRNMTSSTNVKDLPAINPNDYQDQTRYDGFGQPYNVRVPKGTANTSTTTISNANIKSQIPGILNRTNQLTDTGIRTDASTGTATYANGTAYSEPNYADTSAEDRAIQENLDAMKASTDAATANMIENIQRRFEQRRIEQRDINERQKKGTTNALLMGGATGAGSSAQYAPISSEGIIGAQEAYGVKQLADLDAQEQDLIAQAKAAQSANDFKLLEKKNAQIEETRKAKMDAAAELNKKIIEQNAKARETAIQSTRDSAIADLYSQGITSPSDILNYLNNDNNGNLVGDITLKEVSDALKNLVPTGLDDLVKTLRSNGAPQDVIQKVLSSSDINNAYKAAGSWGAGGTGIIGEYNLYKAQAESAGQVPMDFNAYQNIDANRKIKIAAAANASGLTSAMTNTALKLSDDYETRSKDFYQQREAYNRIVSSATDPSAAGDLALIFNYMKVLDPGSTVREGEFANAQNAGSAYQVAGAKYNKVLNGQRLTEKQRADFLDRATKLFNGAKTQQDSVASEFKKKAEKYGVPGDLVVRDTSATGSIAKDAVKDENDAKNIVLGVSKTNPKAAGAIRKALETGTAYIDIISAFPEYFSNKK